MRFCCCLYFVSTTLKGYIIYFYCRRFPNVSKKVLNYILYVLLANGLLILSKCTHTQNIQAIDNSLKCGFCENIKNVIIVLSIYMAWTMFLIANVNNFVSLLNLNACIYQTCIVITLQYRLHNFTDNTNVPNRY